jgi:hypothetical protein
MSKVIIMNAASLIGMVFFCCHILKVFVTLGIKTIPDNYILERWAQDLLMAPADGGDAANVFVQSDLVAHGMPLSGRKTLWFQICRELLQVWQQMVVCLMKHIGPCRTI